MSQRNPASHRMPRTAKPRSAWFRAASRVLVATTSCVALVATGTLWWGAHDLLGGFTVSAALPSDAERSSGGAMNILLIGLDSRKDQDGNDLPQEVLDQLHAGDSDQGGYNTNTLILMHVSPDDKVTAFSIPRDDYVAFNRVPGYRHIKIKEAYGLTKFYAEQKLADEGVSDQAELEKQGREAGRAATLSAVRNLVGVPIDYFAEVNLAGFYDLAVTLGGVEVCLNHAVHDDYSGADLPAGHQRLNASQALAFVRQRHGLDNGDLDRTHRQQAFLVSVIHQLQDSGTFSNLGKLQELLAVARKDIVFSDGWDVDRLKRLSALADPSAKYETLPVLRYDVRNGQDVNIIDPKQIRAKVRAAFSDGDPTTSPHPPSSIVDVVNASRLSGVAASMSGELSGHGYPVGEVRDATADDPTSTVIEYGSGAERDAEDISGLLGDIPTEPDSGIESGRVHVVLGDDYSPQSADELAATSTSQHPESFSEGSTTTTPTTTTTTTTKTTSTTPTTTTPDQGQPFSGGEIPCVN
jgi:LCP family protein required for cell wall assembly